MFGKHFWLFVGGTAAGLFVRTKACRKLAVNAVASGMMAKDCVNEGIENIKEEANDIYEDAKKKKAEADAAKEEA